MGLLDRRPPMMKRDVPYEETTQGMTGLLGRAFYPDGYSGGLFGMEPWASKAARYAEAHRGQAPSAPSADQLMSALEVMPGMDPSNLAAGMMGILTKAVKRDARGRPLERERLPLQTDALQDGILGKARQNGLIGDDLPMDEASRMARAREMGFDVDAYHAAETRAPIPAANYPGTSADIQSFDMARAGANSGNPAGVAFTTDPAVARSYVESVQFVDNPAPEFAAGTAKFRKIINRKNATPAEKASAHREYGKLLIDYPQIEKIYPAYEAATYPVKIRTGHKMEFDAAGGTFKDIDIHNKVREAVAGGYDSLVVKNVIDPGNASKKDARNIANTIIVFNPKNIRSRFAKFDPAKKGSANLLAGVAGAGLLGVGASEYLNNTPILDGK
jgi:hypothetical protein